MFKNLLIRRAVRHALVANAARDGLRDGAGGRRADRRNRRHRLAHRAPGHRSVDAGAGASAPRSIDHAGLAERRRHPRGAAGVGTPGLSRTNSNFLTISNGVSTVNLRNMEDQRTLVLINGRRVVAGVGGTSIVDVNNIPTDLIESVQVLTGGASAVYGSEAVAGVVNFILKDDFEGLSFRGADRRVERGRCRASPGVAHRPALNIGDRGNITGNMQYDKDDGLRSRNREISANDIPARSGFPPQGRFPARRCGDWTFGPDNVLQDTFVTAQRRLQSQRRALHRGAARAHAGHRARQLRADRFGEAVRRRQLLEDGVELEPRAARDRQLRCGAAGRHDPAGPVARQSVHPGADPGARWTRSRPRPARKCSCR